MNQNNDELAYVLDLDQLRPADVILTAGNGTTSKAVRLATGGDFSHAMLYIGNTVVHAETAGVFTTNPQRHSFAEKTALVLRNPALSPTQAAQACRFAEAQAGNLYSVPEAMRTMLRANSVRRSSTKTQFCSRLVAQAYASVGVLVVPNPDYCSPEDLRRSNVLSEVPNTLRLATIAERMFQATPDTVKIHQDHTYAWLDEVRMIADRANATPVLTLSDAFNFVYSRPEYDDEVASHIEASGYLDDYRIDELANPHRYDVELFRKLLESTSTPVHEVIERERGINRNLDRKILEQWLQFRNVPLKTYRLVASMHMARLEQLKKRIAVLRSVEASFSAPMQESDSSLSDSRPAGP